MDPRVAEAQAKAIRDLSTSFENTREYQLDQALNAIHVETLCFAWIDPKNRAYITRNIEYLMEQRDHLSRLIEKIEAQTPQVQAAE